MGSLARVAPLLACVPMILGLMAWRSDCQNGYDCANAPIVAVLLVVVIGVLAAGMLLAALAARRLFGRPAGAAFGRRRTVAVLCAAIVLATPVRAGWDDGCNLHGGRFAMLEAPRIWLTEPGGFVLGYVGYQTLVNCP